MSFARERWRIERHRERVVERRRSLLRGRSMFDAAAYYCPYVPLTTSGVILDPERTDELLKFMSRYSPVEVR